MGRLREEAEERVEQARGDEAMSETERAAFDGVTRHLRARDWTPVLNHTCGCRPGALCQGHAEVRAVEHYHPEVDVTECPDCGQKGHYDGRVLIGGRGVYTCPERHRWQDANEKPTTKGIPL